MLTVKICDLDGTVIWAGIVPPENVKINRPPNAPSTCTISGVMADAMRYLEFRPVQDTDDIPGAGQRGC